MKILMFNIHHYYVQAPDLATKDVWVAEIKRVLMTQFDHLKGLYHFTSVFYFPYMATIRLNINIKLFLITLLKKSNEA